MVFDTLENAECYRGLGKGLALGLAFLRDTDFSKLADGRYELDGDRVVASISGYETKTENDRPEAHRAYADLQYLISGTELVGVAPLADMEFEVEANREGDIWFYRGDTEKLTLTGDRFLVLFPQDAHAPCIAAGQPKTVRKCVVKIRV